MADSENSANENSHSDWEETVTEESEADPFERCAFDFGSCLPDVVACEQAQKSA